MTAGGRVQAVHHLVQGLQGDGRADAGPKASEDHVGAAERFLLLDVPVERRYELVVEHRPGPHGQVQTVADADGRHGGSAHDVERLPGRAAGDNDGAAQFLAQVVQGLGPQYHLAAGLKTVARQHGQAQRGVRVPAEHRDLLAVDGQYRVIPARPGAHRGVPGETGPGRGEGYVTVAGVRGQAVVPVPSVQRWVGSQSVQAVPEGECADQYDYGDDGAEDG
jgi:hypothetical protein